MTGWKRRLKDALSDHQYVRKRPLGALLGLLFPKALSWLDRGLVDKNSRILDVGCGSGHLLAQLSHEGFRHLEGTDPFLPTTVQDREGYRVHRFDMDALEGPFDLIMAHHSLEHLADQRGFFRESARLLTQDGNLLVRVPNADSYAFRKFREHWVQLDCPRHLYLHTVAGLRILAAESDFEIVKVCYDSTEFQFLGSQSYQMGMSLASDHWRTAGRPEQRQSLRRFARHLNSIGDGDSLCVHFRLQR
jgi:SAM-dependent methyltransferase